MKSIFTLSTSVTSETKVCSDNLWPLLTGQPEKQESIRQNEKEKYLVIDFFGGCLFIYFYVSVYFG